MKPVMIERIPVWVWMIGMLLGGMFDIVGLLFGILGVFCLLEFIIISTKEYPVVVRIAYVFFAIAVFLKTVNFLTKITGYFTEYSAILDKAAVISFLVMIALSFIGCFQKMPPPYSDPNMRRRSFLLIFGCIIVVLLCILIPIVVSYFI